MNTIIISLIGMIVIAMQCNIYDKIEKLNNTIDELKKHLNNK